MIVAFFLVTLLSTLVGYGFLAGRLARRQRSVAMRRVVGKRPAAADPVASAGPLLMPISSAFRGRWAIRLLESLRLQEAARRLLERAGLKWSGYGLIHRSIALFLAAFLAFTLASRNAAPRFAFLGSSVVAMLPWLYARRKASRRMRRFEEQFPDCLEFIARSMRAGHAFSVSFEMVHHEFSDPLAAEFRRTFEEQNLGQPLEIVLTKLRQRVPSMDVQFFVSAVLLQKRTGGNLAELLDKLAQIIRERFKLRARIRAISAQGLLSGRVLSAVPLAVGGLMFVVNPSYARFFLEDPVGHQLLAGAVGLQLVGYLIIRKIVSIEV